MFDALRAFAGNIGAILAAFATGAAWIVTLASPKVAKDKFDHSRADTHTRHLIKRTSDPLAAILLAAGALCILGGAYAAGAAALLSALGFFTNRYTLAPKKATELRQRRAKQRSVAVSFTLLSAGAAAIAAVLAILGL